MRPTITRTVRRAASRGLTLVELIIVITIIGVLTAAISMGVMRAQKQANIGVTTTACNNARNQVVVWRGAHPGEDCPTVEQLKKEKYLGGDFNLKDPWGNALKLSCESDEVTCSTAGPDRKEGTDDDIRVPKGDNSSGN